ncbi:hypothetical protein D3C87_1950250 [compost metagenome]
MELVRELLRHADGWVELQNGVKRPPFGVLVLAGNEWELLWLAAVQRLCAPEFGQEFTSVLAA